MMQSLDDELLNKILDLPEKKRKELVEIINNSLSQPSNEEIDAIWAEECEKRLDAMLSGKMESIPGEIVLKEINDDCTK